MSKVLNIFCVAGVLALTSCSNSDVLNENPESGSVIGFNSYVSNSSRAVANENFTKFFVYGGYQPKDATDYHTVFSGVEVSKSVDNKWTYSGASKYWVADASYKFYAYSCEHIELSKGAPSFVTTADDAGHFKITDYICGDAHQHDLVFAESGAITGKETGNSAVSLTFKHVLSKVNVKFKSSFPAGFKINISDVQIRNMYDKANFSSKLAERWSDHSRTVAYDAASSKWTKTTLNITGTNTIEAAVTGDTPKDAVDVTTDTGYFIPAAYTDNIYLNFKIAVVDSEGTTIKSDYIQGSFTPTWSISTAYTYNVTVNGSAAGVEAIEFTVDADNGIEEWTESPANDFNFGS